MEFSKSQSSGIEKKQKSLGCPTCWGCGGKDHLRDCFDLNEAEKSKVIQRRRDGKPRVASILDDHLDTKAWIERKVRYPYTVDSGAFEKDWLIS